MAERDDYTHLIWDNESNLDNLIIEIGQLIMATNFNNNVRYPANVTGQDKTRTKNNFHNLKQVSFIHLKCNRPLKWHFWGKTPEEFKCRT